MTNEAIAKLANNFFSQNAEKKILIISLFFWLALVILNPNNKIILALICLMTVYFSYISKNLKVGLLLSFVLTLPLNNGKLYQFEVIPINSLWSFYFPGDYLEYVVVRPSHILSFFMLLILIRDLTIGKIKYNFFLEKKSILLFSSFFIMGVSSFLFSTNTHLSSLIYLLLLQIPILNFYLRAYSFKNAQIPNLIKNILAVSVIALSLITIVQFIISAKIGLSIEVWEAILIDTLNLEQLTATFRPFATFYHPNDLASYLLLLTPLFISEFVAKRNGINFVTMISSMLIIILTQSRTAWLFFILGVIILLFFYKKIFKMKILENIKINLKIILFIVLSMIIAITIILPRIISSLYAFQETGGVNLRSQQSAEASNVILNNSVFGVGLGMSVPYIFNNFANSTVVSFPSRVHNGYLLLAMEVGIPASLLFLLFIFSNLFLIVKYLVKNMYKFIYSKALSVSILIGLLSFMFNAFFQPLLIPYTEHHFELFVILINFGLYFAKDNETI